jgi:hypothetical protein
VGAAAWRATHAAPGPFTLDAMGDALRGVVARGDVRVEGDTLAVAPTALGKPASRRGVPARAGGARQRLRRRAGGAPRALPRPRPVAGARDSAVRVADQGCRVASPIAGDVARDAGRRRRGRRAGAGLAAADVRLVAGAPETVVSCADTGVVSARAVTVQCGAERVRVDGAARAAPGRGAGGRRRDVRGRRGAARRAGLRALAERRGGARDARGTPAFAAALDSTLARALPSRRDDAAAAAAPSTARGAARSTAPSARLQARVASGCAAAAGGRLRQCAVTLRTRAPATCWRWRRGERPGFRARAYPAGRRQLPRGARRVAGQAFVAAAVLARYPRLRTLEATTRGVVHRRRRCRWRRRPVRPRCTAAAPSGGTARWPARTTCTR